MPEYSLTVKFGSAAEMADYLQRTGNPTHSNVSVNQTTGEVGGSVSASASSPGDPWDDGPASTEPVSTSSGPVKVVIQSPKGPQTWTFNATNAPTCGCGMPAAFQEGSTNNKPWKRWTCAKRRPDEDSWKSACEFSEFSGGRGKK